jgi:hypothetical protein
MKLEGTFMGISTGARHGGAPSYGGLTRTITDACCLAPDLAFDSSPRFPSSFECLYHSTVSTYRGFCVLPGTDSAVLLRPVRERAHPIDSGRFLHSIDRETLIDILLLFAVIALCLGLGTRCRETNIHIFSLHRIDRDSVGERGSVRSGSYRDSVNQIETIRDALRRKTSLHIYLQLDYNRSTRPGSSSAALVAPLLKDFPDRCHVSLFRSPKLKGVMSSLVPARFNEGFGTWHAKIYGADDTVIISG